MNKNNLFYLILFVITSVPMVASTNRKPSNQNQQDPYYGASAPTIDDDADNPYKGASAPPLEQDEYQGYPDLSQQNNSGLDPYKASFLTAQQMEEFMTLSPEDQRALATCSIEEIKQVLNERLAKKAQRANKQTQFDRDTEEAKRRSIQEQEDEDLARAYQNSEYENYPHAPITQSQDSWLTRLLKKVLG